MQQINNVNIYQAYLNSILFCILVNLHLTMKRLCNTIMIDQHHLKLILYLPLFRILQRISLTNEKTPNFPFETSTLSSKVNFEKISSLIPAAENDYEK